MTILTEQDSIEVAKMLIKSAEDLAIRSRGLFRLVDKAPQIALVAVMIQYLDGRFEERLATFLKSNR